MGTKTITVTEEAYNAIKGIKSEKESFSHLLIRLGKEKSITDKYFGILKGDVNDARKNLKKVRVELSKDFKERENVFSRHKRSS
jgi:predicted CopG family antitoxin